MEYSAFLEKLLNETAEIARKNFGKVEGWVKPQDSNQVLTETDIEIGRFITAEIKRNFPKHNIIDEDSGIVDNRSDCTWVIDPIDGTSNFAVGVVTYGTMIGLLNGSIPIAGGLSLPSLGQIVIAEKGKGAFLNRKKIKVSNEKNLSQTLVSIGIDPDRDIDKVKKQMAIFTKILLGSRNLRSSNSVFDLVMIAKGSYGGWVGTVGKIWDNVAPQIVIEEAGGIYTDIEGKPLDYEDPLNKTNVNYTSCAASPVLHKKLQEIIRSS